MNNILQSKIDIASDKLSKIHNTMDNINDVFKAVESELKYRKINISAELKFKQINNEEYYFLVYGRVDGEFRIHIRMLNAATMDNIITFWENSSRELRLEILPFLLPLLEQIINNIDTLHRKANETIPKIKELIE